jgi:prophage regulatory protein
MPSELFLTAEELEDLTGIPASTFRYWAHVGQSPPSMKLGRRRVWKKADVMDWIAEQERATKTTPTANAS